MSLNGLFCADVPLSNYSLTGCPVIDDRLVSLPFRQRDELFRQGRNSRPRVSSIIKHCYALTTIKKTYCHEQGITDLVTGGLSKFSRALRGLRRQRDESIVGLEFLPRRSTRLVASHLSCGWPRPRSESFKDRNTG